MSGDVNSPGTSVTMQHCEDNDIGYCADNETNDIGYCGDNETNEISYCGDNETNDIGYCGDIEIGYCGDTEIGCRNGVVIHGAMIDEHELQEIVIQTELGSQEYENQNENENISKNENINEDSHRNEVIQCTGTLNPAYSSDSIAVLSDTIENPLPIIDHLTSEYNFRYSVVIDNIGITGDESIDFSEALAGPSTFSPELYSHIEPLQRTCSCNCHTMEKNKPTYDDVVMSVNRNQAGKSRALDVGRNQVDTLHVPSIRHDDVNCNGVSCNTFPSYSAHARNLIYGIEAVRRSPAGTPGNTPGRFRRRLPAHMLQILNSSGSSPVSGKAPPNYRSLIFSILQDEPPKYEEVTGKKLQDELLGFDWLIMTVTA